MDARSRLTKQGRQESGSGKPGSLTCVSERIGILQTLLIFEETVIMRKIWILNTFLLVAIAAVAVTIATQIW